MSIELIRGNIREEYYPQLLRGSVNTEGEKVVKRTPKLSSEAAEKNLEPFKDKTLLDEAIVKLRDAFDIFSRRLDFEIDEKTNRIMVKVIDTKTDKVIKEIPPEQIIQLAAKIQEMVGILVNEER